MELTREQGIRIMSLIKTNEELAGHCQGESTVDFYLRWRYEAVVTAVRRTLDILGIDADAVLAEYGRLFIDI